MSQIVIKSYEQCVTVESQGFPLPVLSCLENERGGVGDAMFQDKSACVAVKAYLVEARQAASAVLLHIYTREQSGEGSGMRPYLKGSSGYDLTLLLRRYKSTGSVLLSVMRMSTRALRRLLWERGLAELRMTPGSSFHQIKCLRTDNSTRDREGHGPLALCLKFPVNGLLAPCRVFIALPLL